MHSTKHYRLKQVFPDTEEYREGEKKRLMYIYISIPCAKNQQYLGGLPKQPHFEGF